MAQQKSVSATNFSGTQGVAICDKTPDECPICHRGIDPRVVTGIIVGEFHQPDSKLRVAFQCPRHDCRETFFGFYAGKPQGNTFVYLFKKVAPATPPAANFPESVVTISPDFVSIYNQAIAAESADLDQISGIGLRKALEFLIKDFCINQHPTEIAVIKKTDLGKCINTYCDDTRLKSAASRAVWLGNDEAHYTRKWIDKDISDLKTLIRLSVNWIENVLLTQQYDKEMDPNKPPAPV
jgi:hypothetical protein